MSYSGSKGAGGEREWAEFLSVTFKEFGHRFIRIGNTEKNKKLSNGDVIVDPRAPKGRGNVLHDYFLEVKTRARMDPFAHLEEAESNARTYGKAGGILYMVRQEAGHKRTGEMVAMSRRTFARLVRELQGYREGEE